MGDSGTELENLKEDVRKKLSELSVAELAQVCGELSLDIPSGKEGKKSAVYNLIARELMTKEEDDEDEWKAAFEGISAVLVGVGGTGSFLGSIFKIMAQPP